MLNDSLVSNQGSLAWNFRLFEVISHKNFELIQNSEGVGHRICQEWMILLWQFLIKQRLRLLARLGFSSALEQRRSATHRECGIFGQTSSCILLFQRESSHFHDNHWSSSDHICGCTRIFAKSGFIVGNSAVLLFLNTPHRRRSERCNKIRIQRSLIISGKDRMHLLGSGDFPYSSWWRLLIPVFRRFVGIDTTNFRRFHGSLSKNTGDLGVGGFYPWWRRLSSSTSPVPPW